MVLKYHPGGQPAWDRTGTAVYPLPSLAACFSLTMPETPSAQGLTEWPRAHQNSSTRERRSPAAAASQACVELAGRPWPRMHAARPPLHSASVCPKFLFNIYSLVKNSLSKISARRNPFSLHDSFTFPAVRMQPLLDKFCIIKLLNSLSKSHLRATWALRRKLKRAGSKMPRRERIERTSKE